MFRYLPFPLNIEGDTDNALIPEVGHEDIFAYGKFNTYQVLSSNDLTRCLKLNDMHFCRGRQILKTDFTKTCLSALFKKHIAAIKDYCKFEIQPIDERVYQIAKDTYIVHTNKEIATNLICKHKQESVFIKSGQSFKIPSGCRISLIQHKLYAEDSLRVDEPPQVLELNFDSFAMFGNLSLNNYKEALGSLNNFSQHIVEPEDLLHHAFELQNARRDNDPFNVSQLSIPLALIIALTITSAISIGYIIHINKKLKNLESRFEESRKCQPTAPYAPVINTVFSSAQGF